MKPEQIVGLIIRCLALYLFFAVTFPPLVMLNETPTSVGDYAAHSLDPTYILLIALGTVVPLFLWFFALDIARKLIPSDADATVKAPLTFEQLETLCFSIFGLWLALRGATDFLYRLLGALSLFATQRQQHNAAVYLMPYLSHFVTALIYLAAGLLLLFRTGPVVRAIKKIRGGIN